MEKLLVTDEFEGDWLDCTNIWLGDIVVDDEVAFVLELVFDGKLFIITLVLLKFREEESYWFDTFIWNNN